MNRIIRFLKLLKKVWFASGQENDNIFIYGTKDKALIDKFKKLVSKRKMEWYTN